MNDVNNIELGYNTNDNCEYIDYDLVVYINNSQKDLRVVQINTCGNDFEIRRVRQTNF